MSSSNARPVLCAMDSSWPGVPRPWPLTLQSPQSPRECGLACSGQQGATQLRAAGPTCALTAQSSGLLPAASLLGQRLCLATRGQCSPRWAWVGLCPAGSVRACMCVCIRGGGTRVEARPIVAGVPSSPAPQREAMAAYTRNLCPSPCAHSTSGQSMPALRNFQNPPGTEACWGWAGHTLVRCQSLPEHLKELSSSEGPSPRDPRGHTPQSKGLGARKKPQRLYLEALQLPSRKAIFFLS